MMYFLDTNTCIDFLRNLSESVRSRFLSVPLNEIKIPVVVKAELLLGAYKSTKPETLERTKQFLELFEVIPFSDEMSYTYAKIRKELEVKGNKIGANDLFIAASALNKGAVLVTHNTREFIRIDGLKLEDWNI
ncbi:type II toxin-antitoxin system VapC family toxin [uncultured Treponema sp.]|uniref:type II toxin-antitoxin system VapC family toxin n=1 Tax=uncultured Treponema sp. TaxID=162155 RepID=UPI00258D65A6|nr:type II toxin-antitoxin system VapC family toxin [uncultured Treponema sp.]